jgi:hypothetical protein
MFDGGRLVGASILALALAAAGTWVADARGPAPLVLAAPAPGSSCLAPPAVMRRSHPSLLADWRARAVRRGERRVTAAGPARDGGLGGTCLRCHGDATAFCERCHAAVGAAPNCWGCHPTAPPPESATRRRPDGGAPVIEATDP